MAEEFHVEIGLIITSTLYMKKMVEMILIIAGLNLERVHYLS